MAIHVLIQVEAGLVVDAPDALARAADVRGLIPFLILPGLEADY